MPGTAERCEVCGAALPARSAPGRSRAGRRARYCSNSCRQRAYRRRTAAREPRAVTDTPGTVGQLTRALDSFVGRDRELLEIQKLLRGHRLVTLMGTGGAGKTRLATEVGLRVQRRYRNGVWLIELAPVTDCDGLIQTVAGCFGVPEEAGRPFADTLLGALAEHHMLLLLDNCEHRVHAVAEFTERLLRGCPDVRVLATSRGSLDLPGEVVYKVGELALPAAGQDGPAASSGGPLLVSDAVRLFVERARAADPEFELTRDNVRDVEAVCTRLDGLPLAIELAARRVRLLPVADIRARLDDRFRLLTSGTRTADDRFRLLTSGTRTADERHRDLRATIAWSHDLLEPPEQALMRRLSVLAGGFGVATAAAVGADGALVARDAVLDLLGALEGRSLIVPERGTAVARFRQLETIRLYERELLDHAQETDSTMDRLADHLVDLAEPIVGDAILHCYQELEPLDSEKPGLAAAIDWCAARDDARRLPLAAALGRCWRHQGQASLGHDLLRRALADTSQDHPARGAALEQAAVLEAMLGRHDQAATSAAEAERLARQSGSTLRVARALDTWSRVRLAQGRTEEARACGERCLRLVEPLGRPLDTAVYMQNYAWDELRAGRSAHAAELMRQCLPMYREHSPYPLPPEWLHTAGILALATGDVAEAEEHLREGLQTYLPTADSGVLPAIGINLLESLVVAAAGSNRPLRALRLASYTAGLRRAYRSRRDEKSERELAQALAAARARLTAREAERAMVEGARQRLPEVLRYAVHDSWTDAAVTRDEAVPLTAREQQAARLVTKGFTNREIAARLHVSVRTVESHLENIRTRLDLRSRAQLATWAAQHLGTGDVTQ